MPAATIYGGRSTIVPDQMMTPMVQTSTGLVAGTPGVVTPTPVPNATAPPMVQAPAGPAPTSVFPSLTPTYTPAPVVAATPTSAPTPPAGPVPQNPLPPSAPAAPLADPNVFVSGGQEWMDVDLTPYTRDFAEGSGAEKSVREWILRKFEPSTWTGNQVSSLVVTPSHVKVYHQPAVQKSVCDLLVRFLYYKPGTFQTQVRVVETRDSRWLNKYQSRLLPAGQGGTSSRVWLVRGEDAKEMITDLGGGSAGTLLANPDAVVVNGQHLTVDWAPRPGRKADPNGTGKPTDDGVLVTFSPLIDVDAATVELDLAAAVRRTVEARSNWAGGRNDYQPDTSETNLRELVKIPPGQVVVASLGRIPAFDGGRNIFGQDKTADVLVFVACQPSPGNMVSGRPVEVAQAYPVPAQRSVAARPSEMDIRPSPPSEPRPSSVSEPRPSAASEIRPSITSSSRSSSSRGSASSNRRGLPPELTLSVD
jgi:hypothetical protein